MKMNALGARETQSWLENWETSGYLVVENAVDPATLNQMRGELDRIEAEFQSGALPPDLRRYVFTERDRTRQFNVDKINSDALAYIMELPLFAPVFRDLIVYPRLLDILETLFGTGEFAFHNYKCICKMPGNNAAFQWHRDLPYLQHTTPNLITCMVCLDDMTLENGATVVCPGTHRVAHEAVTAADIDIAETDVPQNRVSVLCPAGSAVLFHVNIIHGGGPNLSATPRRNVISIWAGPDTYPIQGGRCVYQSVMPRSQDPARQKQVAQTFGG